MKGILKGIRGWLGNALVWGVGWSSVTVPIMGVLHVMGVDYFPSGLAALIAKNLFAMGFVAGGTFSTYLGLAHRNKGLDELRPRRFALVGAVFSGLLVPTFTVLPGLGILLGGSFNGAMAGGIALAAALGGATAFGTVKIAQNAALTSGTQSGASLSPGRQRRLTEETSGGQEERA
jgi:hypothetical protein